VVVPTGEAPHKRIDPEPGAEVRLGLAELAFAGIGGVRVSDLEVGREGPSYAYRTLELLSDEQPGSEFTFVMGADVAAGLGSWRRPERVLELAGVAIAVRPEAPFGDARAAVEAVRPGARVERVEMPAIGISSTLVRERVAAGRPVRSLVGEAVAERIAELGIYRQGVPA
jgi:nicotinate-nucleotide adenylyltransferase